jgi:Coenzyme PQQ synthesis protein D (PqqD)
VLERPRPAANLVIEDLDEDVCLYRPDVNEAVVLNRSAADVWRLADGESTVTDIVSQLATAYGVDCSKVERDIQGVVDDLGERGFLIESSPR